MAEFTQEEMDNKYELILYPKKNKSIVRAYHTDDKNLYETQFRINRWTKKFEEEKYGHSEISLFLYRNSDWKEELKEKHEN